MSDPNQPPQDLLPVLGSVDDYLRFCMEYDASDLHLATGAQPVWRRYGNLQPIWDNAALLTPEDARRLAYGFLGEAQIKHLEARGDVDFAYSPGYGRFRSSVVQQRLGIDMVFRVIKTNIKSVEDLGLPPTAKTLTRFHNGLILVTGPVGCGKSTTLAALVDSINEERQDHIITLEDPIEYIIEPKGCHVNQREVHTHTASFAAALRGALREDPDVIMVGEMRDLETISLAITAAETGHLVLGTLHTGSAARTLDRVLDVFPIDQRDQIRIMVSESLRGILSQQLVPKIDGNGRVMALEVLVNTPAVGNCIREGKTYMLAGVMQTGKGVGMITMDDSLRNLYSAGEISREECEFRAEDKIIMKKFFES
ncbi:MAG: type IV pili twitching motility protein PilT [Verrucomicrobia bacterium 12-59-8]|nr:MAG: type IV pili twitching motility protein PilT [Verrucomicrobia bacterium 12-59-8]